MGKTLIIKGADFSENAVAKTKWYNSVTSLQGINTFTNKKIIVDPVAQELMELMGKPVNTVRLYSISAGSIDIGIVGVTGSRKEGTITLGEERATHSYDIIEGENEITLIEPIVLEEGECIYLNDESHNKITYNNVLDDSTALLSENGWCFGIYNRWYAKAGKMPIEFGYVVE